MTLAALALVVALGACSKKEHGASQTAAKVNKEEITVHQINYVLQQQHGLRPDQVDAVSQQILERLIDQELAVQKADDLKLDRDPNVVQQMEAAKREILARAYLARVADSVTPPGETESRQFYDTHPALFKDRHIYDLHEIVLKAAPEQIAALRPTLDASKTSGAFTDYLSAHDIKFADSEAVRSSDQLPPPTAVALAKMNAGDSVLQERPGGAQVLFVSSVRGEPIAFDQAHARIDQELLVQRKREAIAKDLKSLRAQAKIEYVGSYAKHAAAAASAAASATPPETGDGTPAATAAPEAAASGLDAAAINKGMGLK
jgi:EpsD family peptidyl-prolyl cis-trans isomerase